MSPASRIRCGMAVLLLLVCTGCGRRPPVVEIDEEDAAVSASISVADPGAAVQLLSGFHPAEAGRYRWTKGKFVVLLQPPKSGAAELKLRFFLPELVVARKKTVVLTASVEGTRLAPQSYSAPGECLYERMIPAGTLPDRPVRIEFSLDRYFAAGEIESRELGIPVTTVGLLRSQEAGQ